jgi:hypothetical protein
MDLREPINASGNHLTRAMTFIYLSIFPVHRMLNASLSDTVCS